MESTSMPLPLTAGGRRHIVAAALASVVVLWAGPAAAQGASGQSGTSPAPAADGPSRAAFRIEHPATGSSMRVRGLLQADGTFFPDDTEQDNTDGWLLKRIRFGLEGALFRDYEYRFQTELRNNAVDVLDAWIEVKPSPAFRVRVGKGKAPVSLDRLQSPTDVLLYERSYPVQLAPNRDIGAQVLGDIAGGLVSYAAGVFDGTADGGSVIGNAEDSLEAHARLFVHPFRASGIRALRNVGIGIAGTAGEVEGSPEDTGLSRYRTVGGATVFRYDAASVADGDRRRLDVQGYAFLGRVGLLSEWIRSSQDVRRGDGAARVAHEAWNANVSVALTNDRPTYTGVMPSTVLSRDRGTVGAIELAARVQAIHVDRAAFAHGFANPAVSVRRALAWTLGLNWYPHPNARILANYERTSFHGGAPAGDRAPEHAVLTRLMVGI